MPSERKESQMSKSFSRITNDIDGSRKEYLWGCDLSKDAPEHTWNFDEEDEDTDYLKHELLLKLAVLGKDCADGERQIVVAETKDYNGKNLKLTILNLVGGEGKLSMVSLEDLGFNSDINVTFRLVEGSGPVHLTGQHSIDWPSDPCLGDTVLEYTEDEETEATETEEESTKSKGAKRKQDAQAGGKKKQRGKLDSSNLSAASTGDDDEEEEDDDEEDEELDDEDLEVRISQTGARCVSLRKTAGTESGDDEEMASDEDEEEDEEEDEPESSPEKPKKKGKGKAKAAPAKPAAKGKAAAKAPAKKAGKKGKAK